MNFHYAGYLPVQFISEGSKLGSPEPLKSHVLKKQSFMSSYLKIHEEP